MVLLTYYMHALIVCDYVILQMEKCIHFIIILPESYGNIHLQCFLFGKMGAQIE